jgi:hypothetical protein
MTCAPQPTHDNESQAVISDWLQQFQFNLNNRAEGPTQTRKKMMMKAIKELKEERDKQQKAAQMWRTKLENSSPSSSSPDMATSRFSMASPSSSSSLSAYNGTSTTATSSTPQLPGSSKRSRQDPPGMPFGLQKAFSMKPKKSSADGKETKEVITFIRKELQRLEDQMGGEKPRDRLSSSWKQGSRELDEQDKSTVDDLTKRKAAARSGHNEQQLQPFAKRSRRGIWNSDAHLHLLATTLEFVKFYKYNQWEIVPLHPAAFDQHNLQLACQNRSEETALALNINVLLSLGAMIFFLFCRVCVIQ